MEAIERRFPPELLLEPVEQRVSYFENKIITHEVLEESRKEILTAIANKMQLVFLLGAMGVGKTTLLKKLDSQKSQQIFLPWLKRKNIFTIELVASGSRGFSWPDFFRRSLLGLHEMFPEQKIDYDKDSNIRYDSQGRLIIPDRISEPAMRRAFEKCLCTLQLAAFIMDEAPHLMTRTSGEKFQSLMNVVKSLASLSQTIYVLAGTYDLRLLVDQSAQLSRRSHIVYFRRYKAASKPDIKTFQHVIRSLQAHLPLEEPPNFVDDWEYLYEHSLGCIGILKDWLKWSLQLALENNQKTLTKKDLEKCAISSARLHSMASEIIEAEMALEKMLGKNTDLRRILGLEKEKPARENNTPTLTPNNKQKEGSTNKPFQRNPHRDPIGVESYGDFNNL